MSLERQVRVAAGTLVAIGAALAAFGPDATWKAIGTGLAGFVGCGLVFAGLTDTCGMAMLIARMPWNQACRSATSCSTRLLLAALVAAAAGTASAQHTQDSLDAVKAAVAEQKAVLVDVREADEWQQGHVAGARLVPLSVLERGVTPDQLARAIPKGTIIYTYCLVGGRSVASARFFRAQGYDVRPLKQGYPELVRFGFPSAVGN
jgi:rhodanese-related sulfurtransferase